MDKFAPAASKLRRSLKKMAKDHPFVPLHRAMCAETHP